MVEKGEAPTTKLLGRSDGGSTTTSNTGGQAHNFFSVTHPSVRATAASSPCTSIVVVAVFTHTHVRSFARTNLVNKRKARLAEATHCCCRHASEQVRPTGCKPVPPPALDRVLLLLCREPLQMRQLQLAGATPRLAAQPQPRTLGLGAVRCSSSSSSGGGSSSGSRRGGAVGVGAVAAVICGREEAQPRQDVKVLHSALGRDFYSEVERPEEGLQQKKVFHRIFTSVRTWMGVHVH